MAPATVSTGFNPSPSESVLMGQYLTTKGQSPEQDHAMLQTLELQEKEAPILGEYIANG